jgi:hypothetical protein
MLLSAEQREQRTEALRNLPEDGLMWNSREVGERIERRIGRELSNKKQRGWEYLKCVLQPCCNRSSTEPNTAGFAPVLECRKPLR